MTQKAHVRERGEKREGEGGKTGTGRERKRLRLH
jgi:hypothetical protein